jgi:hypothetical protein
MHILLRVGGGDYVSTTGVKENIAMKVDYGKIKRRL